MSGRIEGLVVFVGCARNCGRALRNVLRNIERISGLFADSTFIFVENDSTDSTKRELQTWCAARLKAQLIELDGLVGACPIRTVRLALLRNMCVTRIKAEFASHDYLFVLDCDDANELEIDLESVRQAIEFLASEPSRAGVFANQDGVYYDVWALRHNDWCPGDAWEDVLDYALGHDVSDGEAFSQTFGKRAARKIERDDAPIEVLSAFGGLGIYRIDSILRNKRPHVGYKKKLIPTAQGPREIGWQVCEHVNFNVGFGDEGERLFILPYLVNAKTPEPSAASQGCFPPSAFRSFIFDLKFLEPAPERS